MSNAVVVNTFLSYSQWSLTSVSLQVFLSTVCKTCDHFVTWTYGKFSNIFTSVTVTFDSETVFGFGLSFQKACHESLIGDSNLEI